MNTLALSYQLLNLFCCLFIVKIVFSITNSRNNRIRVILGILIWQLYLFFITKSGITVTVDFPPLFAMYFIIPSFIFTGIFLFYHKNRLWLTKIPNRSITLFQSFRVIVELLLLWSFKLGFLHENVTIEGYNFDMVFGCSAILIYIVIYHLKIGGSKLLLFWNYMGILVLASVIFVFVSTLFVPSLYGFEQTPMTTTFLQYPYILVVAFMMPLAVFFHCLSILSIQRRNF